MKTSPRFLWMLLVSFAVQVAQSVELSPFVNYEYTTGSQDYTSHAGGGGLLFKFPKSLRFSAAYSLFTDSDYSLIQSGTLSFKKSPNPDYDLSAALILSGGKLKDSTDSNSSTSLDAGYKRYITDHLEASAGYRYTTGSISSGINREIRVSSGRRNERRTETRIVEEELTSKFSAHTFSGSAGYEFGGHLSGLFSLLRLAVSFFSDRPNTYSEGIEISYPLPHKFSAGFSYTLSQNVLSNNRTYFSIFASKYF